VCPAGHSPETFRLFEAAEAGSIPIVVLPRAARDGARSGGPSSLDASNACGDPWRPFLASRAPFLWLSSWTDAPAALALLQAQPRRVAAMQKDLLRW